MLNEPLALLIPIRVFVKNGKSIIAVLCKKKQKTFKYALQKDFNVEGHIYSIDAKKYLCFCRCLPIHSHPFKED